MHRQTRMLLSFFSLAGLAALLLADDAGPQCEGVSGFSTTLTYVTNCDTSDKSTHSGTIEIDVPGTDEIEWEGEVLRQVQEGGLDASSVVVNTTCSADDVPADMTSITLEFPHSIRCYDVSLTSASTVDCRLTGDAEQTEPACKIEIQVKE